MPAFTAINLEVEDIAEEQIDTTKELHVDEALKRFQTALRLHAQGPRSREAASVAYDELFECEIFRYREAGTDYERIERYANGEPDPYPEAFSSGLGVDAGGADGVAANLSLALYLSFKNKGQFFLDKLKDLANSDPEWKKKPKVFYNEGGQDVVESWVMALDQDPSDPEVWRTLARFMASMNSSRMKRYCLEAAIELDDDPAVNEVDPPSLAEGLAGEDLKDQLKLLGDEMALSHPVMAPWKYREMPDLIKRHLDPIPFLPDPTQTLTPPAGLVAEHDGESFDDENAEDFTEINTWAALGQELKRCAQDTQRALRLCKSVLESSLPDVEVESQPKAEASSEGQEKPADESAPSVADGQKGKKNKITEDSKSSEKTAKERSQSAPTRKRSQSAAGLPEGVEEEVAEKRSKRVRRRETEENPDPSTIIANQLQPYQEVDSTLFQITKNILENLGLEDKETLERINQLQDSSAVEDRLSKVTQLAAKDLRLVVSSFKTGTVQPLLNKEEQATLGLSSFLEHAKSGSQDQVKLPPFDEKKGVRSFAASISERGPQLTIDDIAFEWIKTMSESYTSTQWSDHTKLTVVQMLNRHDASICALVTEALQNPLPSLDNLLELESLVVMLLELYVDIYERITNPSSVVDYATRMLTKDRMGRWLNVVASFIRQLDKPDSDQVVIRFLWASTMVSALVENPVREHILLMWTSLRDHMAAIEFEPIRLPNNIVMPIVSPAAADREISKLTTMDFFLSLFQEEMDSPVQVIETLEPVLNPSSVFVQPSENEHSASSKASDASNDDLEMDEPTAEGRPISECAGQGLRDLWKFLLGSSTELRLFLWSRLGDAYKAIDYGTKQFSCYLRGIEMIITDLDGETYAKTADDSRRLLLMRTLKSLDQLLVQALTMALNKPKAFDIIDSDHIKASSTAVAKVNCLLHVVSLCEDEIRVGVTSAPTNNATFQATLQKLRDMQIRAWCLQYTLIKHGIDQHGEFISPEIDMADYLAAVHQVIGARKFCKESNKIFLKLMRVEILRLKNLEHWEEYLEQVLYDLHGLKLGGTTLGVQEHDCPHETLEKKQTMQLVDRVMVLANRMSMKDLHKSDLKITIDHMQQTIGQLKSTPQMIHNLRNFTEYLKKPIHPLRLYRALRGGVSVDAVSVNLPEANLAKHGWFFLLGMIALTKFKGVDLNRRQTPGATDDLRIGATFLRLQLQFTADRWDAWFRLAECFDYELDEAVLWSADKINKDRTDLIKFQRHAIHCYTLALSNSHNVDVDAYEGDPLHDLYFKFGMRLYASSREPFAMEPFKHSEQERFFIEGDVGTYKRILHDEMPKYKVWKFAARLFRMALKRKPEDWKNSYMLAKCYWKMLQTPDDDLDENERSSKISTRAVTEALKDTVAAAHKARKSRSSEPILEPHYKMLSVLCKMVEKDMMPIEEAAQILSEQPLSVPINPDEGYAAFKAPEDFEEYAILNLGKLKDKDKSNWHHRMIMRHARLLFNEPMFDSTEGYVEAKAAFGILRESMFTKTMVMNVWKCDTERPGRHHVYTEQYTKYMVRLLIIMNDRVNMEQLLRRIRKKGADFYHFNDLWQTCVLAYVKLLRQGYHIKPSTDEVFKFMSSDEFDIITEQITEWTATDGTEMPAFNCMKDCIELKKLNASLMRAAPIDDLINDCYTLIYAEVAANLPGLDISKIIDERKAAQVEVTDDTKTANPSSTLLAAPEDQESRRGTPTPGESEKLESGPKARKTYIRRPEVLRKAEAAVLRAMEPKVTKGRVGSISSKRGSQTPMAVMSEDEDDDEDGPDAQVRREALLERDSGDDSDLSDVPEGYDEEMPEGLMFQRMGRRDIQSGEEADSESEGDEVGIDDDEGHDEQDLGEGHEDEVGEESYDAAMHEDADLADDERTRMDDTVMEDETEMQDATEMAEEDPTMMDGDEEEDEEGEDPDGDTAMVDEEEDVEVVEGEEDVDGGEDVGEEEDEEDEEDEEGEEEEGEEEEGEEEEGEEEEEEEEDEEEEEEEEGEEAEEAEEGEEEDEEQEQGEDETRGEDDEARGPRAVSLNRKA